MISECLTRLEKRLEVSASSPLNARSLGQWVQAFRRCVAFESLDVLAGLPVSTDIEQIADKIINQRRGGWCFEVNLLLGELLKRQGFPVTPVLARVTYRRPSPGPLSHLALRVTADQQDWVVDAGFGGPGPMAPLAVSARESCDEWGCRWRWYPSGPDGMQLNRWLQGHWQPIYILSPLRVLPIDIEVASFFLSQWPMSPFRRVLICVAFDGESFWCIEESALVQRDVNWTEKTRSQIDDVAHLQTLLTRHFGIMVSPELCQKAWSHSIAP
ncbi:MAG: arylamine N-acetyltransferase [Rhodoferax sp.]